MSSGEDTRGDSRLRLCKARREVEGPLLPPYERREFFNYFQVKIILPYTLLNRWWNCCGSVTFLVRVPYGCGSGSADRTKYRTYGSGSCSFSSVTFKGSSKKQESDKNYGTYSHMLNRCWKCCGSVPFWYGQGDVSDVQDAN